LDWEDFGFARDDFYPTDFDILGDRIYMTVKNFGIVSFIYDGKQIVEGSLIKLSFDDLELIGWSEVWGIDLAIDGAYTQIVLAGRESLLTFRFLDISDVLYFKREFSLPYVLYDRPELEANS
jgi:hypothetical protein